MFRRNAGLIALTLAFGLFQSACDMMQGAERREEINKTFALTSGCAVTVHNTNGSITVEGWDQDKVDVLAVKTAHGYDDRDAVENLRKLEVIFNSSGNSLNIETRYPHLSRFSGGVTYTLHVPRKLNLRLQTTNGRVEATDVQGQIQLASTNGSLKADNVGGTFKGSTTNGKVSATLLQFTGGDVSLSTTNGSIQLALPEDTNADISAHTTNGSLRTDFPITTQGKLGRHSLRGTIGKGGATIELGTTNGSISITRGSRGTV